MHPRAKHRAGPGPVATRHPTAKRTVVRCTVTSDCLAPQSIPPPRPETAAPSVIPLNRCVYYDSYRRPVCALSISPLLAPCSALPGSALGAHRRIVEPWPFALAVLPLHASTRTPAARRRSPHPLMSRGGTGTGRADGQAFRPGCTVELMAFPRGWSGEGERLQSSQRGAAAALQE